MAGFSILQEAKIPRNGSGSYSLPEAPFVPLTTISSAAVNSDFSDIAAAITGSLARDGQGGMTAVLPLNTDGFTYTNDLNTGMHRTGSDAQAIECGGTDIVAITTTGINVTGSIQQNGISILPVGLGPLAWSGTAAPSGWVLCYGQALSRTTYASLWTFAQAEIALGNTLFGSGDGSTTFTVADLRGRIPAGKDNMGGSAASRLSSTSISPDANTLGGAGGAQVNALSQNNLPNVNFTVTGTGTLSSNNLMRRVTPGSLVAQGGTTFNVTPFEYTEEVSPIVSSLTATAASGGSAASFIIVQPTIITNFIIFAGV